MLGPASSTTSQSQLLCLPPLASHKAPNLPLPRPEDNFHPWLEKCSGPSSPSPIAQHLLEQQAVSAFHAQEPFPPRNTEAPAGSIFPSSPRRPHPAEELSKKAPQIPSTPPREMSQAQGRVVLRSCSARARLEQRYPALGAAHLLPTSQSFTSPPQMNHQMTFKTQQYVSVNHSERELVAETEYPTLNPRENFFKVKNKIPSWLKPSPRPRALQG